jgi:DNA-binding GntR family transcriptional regulator
MSEGSRISVLTREGKRKTAQELVAQNLRRWVVDGTLRPGDRINVDSVAESIGCSIIPVREALRVLAKENIITLILHRGAFVRVLSSDEIEEVYWVRQIIETRALGNAVPNLVQDDWNKLQAMINAMDQVTEAGDVLGYMAIDEEFHLSMYSKYNSEYLLSLSTDAYHASQAYRLAHAKLPGRPQQGNREHKELLAALIRHDIASAQTILQKHLQDTADYLIEFVRQQENIV